VDRTGRLWCGTTSGVAMLADGIWTIYSTTDGLAGNSVFGEFQDRLGAMWFGTSTGLSRFDGASWRSYHTADGLANDWVLSITSTPDSVLWIGTSSNVSRLDSSGLWTTYTTQDGLPDVTVTAAYVERSGNLWFGTVTGCPYEPARVPPQTVITSAPPPLSANTLQTVHFQAAYRQVLGIEFSTSLDAAPWSPFRAVDAWVGRDLPDGVHTLRVVARDALHHVDPTPASATFEIAATPPRRSSRRPCSASRCTTRWS
jgi:hypothetical protein